MRLAVAHQVSACLRAVCCLHSCCAVVSDAGSGGQVLLDSVTFSIIKDRLEELGQVGEMLVQRSTDKIWDAALREISPA